MTAQDHLLRATTEPTAFGTLASIRPGLPVLETLEQASTLLECAEAASREAATHEGDPARQLAWASLSLTQQARAALDAAIAGLYRQRLG